MVLNQSWSGGKQHIGFQVEGTMKVEMVKKKRDDWNWALISISRVEAGKVEQNQYGSG